MALFSLIAVLLLEQFRPLPYQRLVQAPLSAWADLLEERFNAGERSHGVVAWMLGVGGLVLIAGLVYFALYSLSPLLAWLWNVAILYLTMGFRQFSHHYTDIQLALRMNDLPRARSLLADWRQRSADGLGTSDIARLSIAEALAASHRHVFGVLLCFALLPGPCGAVLYRAAAFLVDRWAARPDGEMGDFNRFSRQAFALIDWLPARLTAFGFAIVGNFEDAIYCWRTQAGRGAAAEWSQGLRIVLASGAGALGVRLGLTLDEAGSLPGSVNLGSGEEADVDFMQSAVGLVWRALLLWLLLLLLIGLGSLVRL